MATVPEKGLDELLDERLKLQNASSDPRLDASQDDASLAGAALPPGMKRAKEYSVDELLKEMNRVPLFMTSLDETDGESGENIELEALKALAYEGTRAEIAQNFREQGTELIRMEKRYREARDYYTKALRALKDPLPPPPPDQGPSVVEIDEEAEAEKERSIEEVCLVNRALCNLEMKNYGSCNRDCAAALRINPKNVKAWYRAASACLALDKVDEAIDACQSGLHYDSQNATLKALFAKAEERKRHLAELAKARKEREERLQFEKDNVRIALQHRNIPSRTTDRPPEVPESAIALQDGLDPSSSLSFPVLLLYPVHAQTDFINHFHEDESLSKHLSYVLPLPWDENNEYTLESVECYMETINGGLIKAGKKLSLLKLLSSGKLEIVDGLVKISVVPKAKAAQWIEAFKTRRGKQ